MKHETTTTTTVTTTTRRKKIPVPAPKRQMRLVKRVRTVVVRTPVPKVTRVKVLRPATSQAARQAIVVSTRSVAALPAPTGQIIRVPASSVRVRPGRPD